MFKQRLNKARTSAYCAACTLTTSLLLAGQSYAYQNAENDVSAQSLSEELERQTELLKKQGEQIEALRQQLQQLQKTPANRKQQNTPPAQTNKSSNANTRTQASQGGQASNRPQNNANKQNKEKNKEKNIKPVGQKPPETKKAVDISSIPQASTNVSGILTKPGTIIVELGAGYGYSDSNRVFLDAYTFLPALVVGLIDLREIKRHTFVTSLGSRYGLTNRWEIGAKVNYIRRNDQQRSRPVSVSVTDDEIFKANGNGVGDVELSTRYQLNFGEDGGAIYVVNLAATIPTGKSPFEIDYVESTPGAVFPTELPTGSGYYSVSTSLSAVLPSDPGVLFGSISYANNLKSDEDVGEVNPGDAIGISFGMGISLNQKAAMSFSYSHKHVLQSRIDDVKIDGSELDIGQLVIGYSYNYNATTNLNLSLNIGVTNDAPDLRLDIRVPFAF